VGTLGSRQVSGFSSSPASPLPRCSVPGKTPRGGTENVGGIAAWVWHATRRSGAAALAVAFGYSRRVSREPSGGFSPRLRCTVGSEACEHLLRRSSPGLRGGRPLLRWISRVRGVFRARCSRRDAGARSSRPWLWQGDRRAYTEGVLGPGTKLEDVLGLVAALERIWCRARGYTVIVSCPSCKTKYQFESPFGESGNEAAEVTV